MEGDGERKWALAFLLACPACVGGFLLGAGTVFGASVLALRGFVLLALLTLVLGLWARNYWKRRNEDESCHLAPTMNAKSP